MNVLKTGEIRELTAEETGEVAGGVWMIALAVGFVASCVGTGVAVDNYIQYLEPNDVPNLSAVLSASGSRP